MTSKTLLLTKLAFYNDNGFNTIFSLYITEIFFYPFTILLKSDFHIKKQKRQKR